MKAHVSMPNGITISLESTEPEEVSSLVAAALKELPVALLQVPSPQENVSATPLKGKSVIYGLPQALEATDPSNVEAFKSFCQRLAPVGDMRRLIVAAEGARRFLGMGRVSPAELEKLFDYAGWPVPPNLVQTLRNAARNSFGWMERVAGRQGYYTVSTKGVQAVIDGG